MRNASLSSLLDQPVRAALPAPAWSVWLPTLAGLALVYVPIWWGLAHTTWQEEEQSHGPIVLLVAGFLAWQQRHDLAAVPSRPQPLTGWALFGLGLVLYVVGHLHQVVIFEVASQIPVLLGILLLAKGAGSLRMLWFPVLFLVFMIPLPGFLVSDATSSLKESVSAIVDASLYQLGYPVARSGVTLTIGHYQLLVADTCSGLNSIIALAAVGLLYVRLMWRPAWLGNALLMASILPIAYAANVLRVIFLALLTYHVGDTAAQGALHSAAGVVMFLSAVLLLGAFDALLMLLIAPKSKPLALPVSAANAPLLSAATTSFARLQAVGLVLLGVGGLALIQFAPSPRHAAPIGLPAMIPQRFGDWQWDRSVPAATYAPKIQALMDVSDNEILSRTYVNTAGQRLMLVLTSGKSDQLHNPEVCYPGQGIALHSQADAVIDAGYRSLPVKHLLTYRGKLSEPVTYWVMVGDQVSRFGATWRLRQLKDTLFGQVQTGIVFRVSNVAMEPNTAYGVHAEFIRALAASVSHTNRDRLFGAAVSGGN